jgi:hypothetical protein
MPTYNKFYYRPLPEYLTLGTSEIEGTGVFAKEKLEANLDLGMTHIKVPIINGYIRTPLGGFVNHTEAANCYLVQKLDWDDYRVFHLCTMRPIKKGEELTLNYHLDED